MIKRCINDAFAFLDAFLRMKRRTWHKYMRSLKSRTKIIRVDAHWTRIWIQYLPLNHCQRSALNAQDYCDTQHTTSSSQIRSHFFLLRPSRNKHTPPTKTLRVASGPDADRLGDRYLMAAVRSFASARHITTLFPKHTIPRTERMNDGKHTMYVHTWLTPEIGDNAVRTLTQTLLITHTMTSAQVGDVNVDVVEVEPNTLPRTFVVSLSRPGQVELISWR